MITFSKIVIHFYISKTLNCFWKKFFSVNEIACLRKIFSVYEMSIFRKSYLWNVLSIKYPIFEMSYIWNFLSVNVLFIKCPINVMSLYKRFFTPAIKNLYPLPSKKMPVALPMYLTQSVFNSIIKCFLYLTQCSIVSSNASCTWPSAQ